MLAQAVTAFPMPAAVSRSASNRELAPRGASVRVLADELAAAGAEAVTSCASLAAAYTQACDMATENDRILVFGSFHTVAAVMQERAGVADGAND